jgi:hypothetical protein
MTKPSRKCRRPADSGVPNLESITEVKRLQKDMLDRLQRSTQDPISYVGLAYCSPKHCGRIGCSEACAFGTRRRRGNDIPKIVRLLEQRGGPLHEVRIYRRSWDRPFGELANVSVAVAKQLLHRVLDSLFDPTLVAVGTFKVAPDYIESQWKCEMHLIVAGAEKDNLVTRFSATRPGTGGGDIRVDTVGDLNRAICDVTKCNVQPRRYFFQPTVGKRPMKAQRAEFYRWLSGLDVDGRVIRHGCDRHFNRITNKKPKTTKARAKRRGYPYHLMPYMFGTRENDANSSMFVPKSAGTRLVDTWDSYYDEE